MDDIHHSGLNPKRSLISWGDEDFVPRKFIQVSVTVDPNSGDVYRNAVCSDGYVWMWVHDMGDWVPLPSCPQDEVKI